MTVIDLVNRERGRLSRLIAAAGGAAAIGCAALLLAAGVVTLGRARWIDLPRVAPFVVWLAVAVVAALGFWWTRRRLARDASVNGLAFEVEREQALRAGVLRGALEVASSGTLGRYNAEQVAKRLAEKTRGKTLTPTLTRRALIRTGGAAVACGLGILLLATRSSATPDGWRAIAHPVKAWSGTLLAPISLESAPKSVLRGERLTLSVSAPDRRRITVYQRAKGAAWRASQHEVHDGVAKVRLAPMDADLAIFATDGRTVSDTASLQMVERPFIGDVSVTATFPAYLDRREETLPVGEVAQLPRGTVLAIAGHSSTELTRVSLARATDTLHLTTSGRSFTGRMAVVQGGRYDWSAAGVGGPITELPAALEFEVVPDSAPHIEILSPGADTTVSAADTIPLSFLATDDHGLTSVTLRVWRQPDGGTAMPETARPLLSQPSSQWTGNATLSLAAIGTEPGEAVHVVATAVDGSPWRQSGSSRELVLRVPGVSEARANARAAADSAVQRAQAAAAAQKSLQQRTNEAARARQRNQKNADGTNKSSMSYESAQQAQALAKEQRELAERMQQLQENAKQIEKQLKQSGALDSALSARLQEAQKLLRDALTPELAEKLRKLEESAQKLSAEDAQRALGDLAQQQNKLREQLEKSVEMLKRAALEGSMQTLKEEAKDLAKDERANADSMSKAREQAQKQEAQNNARDLADRSRDLAKQIDELQKRLERENAEPGAKRVNDANQQVKESAQAMDRAARNQPSPPQSGQRSPQQQSGQQQGQQQPGQQQPGQQQAGQQQAGQQQNAQGEKSQDKTGQPQKTQDGQPGAQKAGEGQQSQAGQQSQPGQQGQQSGQQSGQQQSGGQQSAKDAADAMQRAADQLADARQKQIDAWKQELTGELDQSIQEMLQLSRQQEQIEQKARQNVDKQSLQAEQSALQQGVQQAGKRLGEAGQKSSLLSPRTQRSVSDAQKKVEQATRDLSNARQTDQAAASMREASEALNQAAATLVRDRERAQNASSASGFQEMLEQMKDMAQQQGSLNAQTAELIPRPGAQLDQQGRDQARQLGRQQREVASSLEDMGDRDKSGRADELAKEARQLAQALESGALDPNVVDRQQRLFRRMLDAGRTLERDEREDNGKREAKAATGNELFLPPNAAANGKAASKFAMPSWNDLRGLTPEERRLVLDYFKRINAEKP
jgi:hypothetical protein